MHLFSVGVFFHDTVVSTPKPSQRGNGVAIKMMPMSCSAVVALVCDEHGSFRKAVWWRRSWGFICKANDVLSVQMLRPGRFNNVPQAYKRAYVLKYLLRYNM